ncbi:hypothetical protein BKD84_10595 [Corynebacterium diphtheriae]|uniref:hypothetical protein n=1 Tax=Corynebacterium diphtheriae TaxID=1717 RepID=UPI0008935A1B|nr:hypothetical protein [Corynebacterium diphtheriae]OFI55235.1 hypothetical protein BKD84_10595 [Corynebacterium diphtheriae]OJI01102.1 hypothetical protein BJU21_03795 [Corynebacterium diphtheriae]
MFKRSLASLAAVAVVSGAVVAPANAVTVTVNNDMCTFNLTDEEANFIGLNSPVTRSKDEATFLKTQYYGEKQLSALEAEIETYKKKLDALGLDPAEEQKLRNDLEEKKKRLTANKNFRKALDECIAGRDYDSSKPDDSNPPSVPKRPEGSDQPSVPDKPVPNNPGDSNPPSVPKRPEGSDQPSVPDKPVPNNPGDSNRPGVPKQPEGSDQPSVPKQPEDSVKPDDKRALPSNNGAVIGVIVAVLGILAAALPVIKSILRALLP